jgi:hypothetical protein
MMFPSLPVSLVLLSTIAIMLAGDAQGAPTDTQKCLALKQLSAGRYLFCRISAAAKFTKTGDAGKRDEHLATCAEKFRDAVAKAEMKYGAACPATPPVDGIDFFLTECADQTTDLTDGGPLPSFCGDGAIDACGGELCDGADLGGATCGTQGFPGGGTLSCTPSCEFDTSACQPARTVGCCQIRTHPDYRASLDVAACVDVSLVPGDDCEQANGYMMQFVPLPGTPPWLVAELAAPGLVCNGATGYCESQRTGNGTCCRIDNAPIPVCAEIGEQDGAICNLAESATTVDTTPWVGLRCLPNSDSTAYGCTSLY